MRQTEVGLILADEQHALVGGVAGGQVRGDFLQSCARQPVDDVGILVREAPVPMDEEGSVVGVEGESVTVGGVGGKVADGAVWVSALEDGDRASLCEKEVRRDRYREVGLVRIGASGARAW